MRLGQVVEADGGDLGPPEQLGSQYAAVTGDYPAVCVDQHRYNEAKRLYAARDLAALPRDMRPRISRVEFQLRYECVSPTASFSE